MHQTSIFQFRVAFTTLCVASSRQAKTNTKQVIDWRRRRWAGKDLVGLSLVNRSVALKLMISKTSKRAKPATCLIISTILISHIFIQPQNGPVRYSQQANKPASQQTCSTCAYHLLQITYLYWHKCKNDHRWLAWN